VQAENSEFLRDFAFRLERAATNAGLDQAEISRRLGIKESSGRVNNWFKARNFPRSTEKPALAKMLNVRSEWLYLGQGEPQQYSTDAAVNEAHSEYGIDMREVPLISWTHAGEATTYEAMPKHWQGTVATKSRDKRAFALRIEGDSMEPKFFAGDCVICEPSGEPRNGKPVVAKYATDAVQLRIYTKLANGRIHLASLKPAIYPPEEHPASAFHWIFPVVGLYRPL
jgi:phage repressor protein C with HTH and peptisase S24 domain